MSHNPQLDSTDDFVHINDNHSAQHKTHDSAYYSLAVSTAKPLSSDLNDSNERNSRENGPIPSPSYLERRPGTSRAGNLTAPPPSRVNPLEDDGLYGLGHQCLNNGFLWPTPCWPNLSLSNLVQPPDIHSAFINTVPTTEAVPYELSLNTGNGPTTGDGEWQPNLPAFDNAQQQGETVAGPVPTDLERSTAAVWVNTWLGQFPGKWPSEETIIKLAALSELRPKIIEGALAGLLYSNATNCSQDHPVSQSKESSRPSPEGARRDRSWDETEDAVLEKASIWVAKHKKKCQPLKKTSIFKSEDSLRIYKCSLDCGWTFSCKDSWKQHEELIYPQEAWICNLDATVLISGTIRCTYCALPDPAIDHLEKVHPKSHRSGSCRQKPFGRGKVFHSKEGIISHFRNIHKNIPHAEFVARYHFNVQPVFERECSLCSNYRFRDWPDRITHMADHFEEHKKALRKEPEVSGTSSSMDPSNMTKSSYCSVVRSSVEAPLSVTHSTGPESSVPSPPERRFANSSPDLESSSTALLDFGHTNGAQPPTLSLSALAGNASILAADTRPQDDEVCSNASTSSDASSIPSAHIADASASTLGDRLKGAFSEQEKSDSMSQSYNRPCSPQTQLGIADSRVPPDLVISRAEVSRGARSSARRETSRLFNPDPVPNARQQLLDARVPNEGRFFIPIDSINSIITKEMVTFQLKAQRDWMHRGRETSIGTMVEDCAPKLFGVLTIICNPGTIVDFLSNGITDRALPLSGSNLSHLTRIPFPRWTSINGYETPPSARWTSWEVEEFCRVQWWFLAPVFEFNPSCRVDHYELEDERVLPYMNSDDKASKVEGGFSEVWPVRIHPSHQRALKPQDDIYPLVAVKRLHSTNKDAFQAEVENLKAFNENKNEHIIELLATYQHQGRYHLVFPYADYNLRSHWKRTPRPWLTPDITLWTVEQMLGLTGAIACIHSSSFVRKPSTTSASHGLLQVDTKEERFGRHGDIKPENILWSNDVNGDEKGMLKITDFGLSQRHSQDSRSRVDPTTIGCSPTYAPPELALQQPVSRSYDIWSLGCVFVECITWLLAGADAIVDFALARGLKNGKAGVDENTFYQLKALRRTPGPIAVVKDSVISWIQQLRENSRCSALVHDLLDLVQFRVLVVEPALRITAQTLAKSLHDMLARGKVDVSYMLTPAPGFSLQNVRPEKRTLCTDPSDTLLEDSAKRQKLPNPL